jgi:hypothetical protein
MTYGIQPSASAGVAPVALPADGAVGVRAANVDHRERYSRSAMQTDDYGDREASSKPLPNFVAAVTAARDATIAAQKQGVATSISWKAVDHRTNQEWMWQAPVGGSLGLAAMLGTATILSGLTSHGASMRALNPLAYWGIAGAVGIAAGAGSFLGLQHFFDGRHHDFHAPAAPTGTVTAPGTAAALPAIPDDVRALAGTKAYGKADGQSQADFGEVVGDLRGYDSVDKAMADTSTQAVAIVQSKSGRAYQVELVTHHLSDRYYDASPANVSPRDFGTRFDQGMPYALTYLRDTSKAEEVQADLAADLGVVAPGVQALVYPRQGRDGTDASKARPAAVLVDAEHPWKPTKVEAADAGATVPTPTYKAVKEVGVAAGAPVPHLVATWGQDAKTISSDSASYGYGGGAADDEVLAYRDIGPAAGYATVGEALGDINARPGDQAIYEQSGRFHVYNTQDGRLLSGHDVVGITTPTTDHATVRDYYGARWDNRKAGTPVALEEFGITLFQHQGWWMTPGTVPAKAAQSDGGS